MRKPGRANGRPACSQCRKDAFDMPDISLPFEIAAAPNDLRKFGIDPDRWRRVVELISGWCQRDEIPAAGLLVARRGATPGVQMFGRQSPAAGAPRLADDAIFLVASITKPIVAMGALLLVERGLMSLDERVEQYLPPFGTQGKRNITIRHLLTHTSGLPDMLPDNRELRAAHAPLAAFVEGTGRAEPHFPAGHGMQYQSMGLAVLAEIIQQVAGKPCARFLHDEFFEPLQMGDTALGAPEDWFVGKNPKVDRIADIRLPAEQQELPQANWNSAYWRKLGAPWGGLLTTPADLGRFARMILQGGRAPDGRQVLAPATIAAATRNQLECLREVPADDRRTRPWGFGWRMNWPAHSTSFGDLLGPRAFGHWGATGTLLWIDPEIEAFTVLLTTQPHESSGGKLVQASNAIAASFV